VALIKQSADVLYLHVANGVIENKKAGVKAYGIDNVQVVGMDRFEDTYNNKPILKWRLFLKDPREGTKYILKFTEHTWYSFTFWCCLVKADPGRVLTIGVSGGEQGSKVSFCWMKQDGEKIEKSKSVPGRGYYFNFELWAKSAGKSQTLVTPSVPHVMALNYQCQKLLKEGMENVWARHRQMGEFVRGWAKQKFEIFCDEKYASNTLTTIKNTPGINVAETIAAIQSKHNTIFGNGYGKIKEQTFRIAHMGDITMDDLKDLLAWIDEEIG